VGRKTPLFSLHQELGARIVDFGGWDMPVQYSSQIGEHHAVRRAAGVFDVSHMCVVDLKGPRVRALLAQLLANDVGKLKAAGKALYSCMLNERGGVIDDLIVYFLTESWFRAVVNAGTRDKDLAWIRRHAATFGVEVTERTDLAMLAIQGPEARAKAAQLLTAADAAADGGASLSEVAMTPEPIVTLPVDLPTMLRQIENAYVNAALTRTQNNKKEAAKLLGMGRTTLVEKLRRRSAASQRS